MIGDRVRITPIAERQGVGEDDLHAARPGAPRMVGAERATPAEQMRQTALVQRGGESAIRRPPVADQDTGEVRAQDGGRVVKTAPGTNRIHGGLWRRERPQPVQHGADAPAGFIGTDDGTPADLGTQGPVGRGGWTSGCGTLEMWVPLTNVCKESKSSQRLNCVESATCESQQ